MGIPVRGYLDMSLVFNGMCLAGAAGFQSAVCFFIASSEFDINANGQNDRISSRWTRTECDWGMLSFVGFGVVAALAGAKKS